MNDVLTNQRELFCVGERRPLPIIPKPTCTPAPIGSGPDGERCGSCRYLFRHEMSKTYFKCELMEKSWTRGAATDIKFRWPACSKWEPLETEKINA